MSNNLRSSVIRLAHANPELRPHLLPLLKTANEGTALPLMKVGGQYHDVDNQDIGQAAHTAKRAVDRVSETLMELASRRDKFEVDKDAYQVELRELYKEINDLFVWLWLIPTKAPKSKTLRQAGKVVPAKP